MELCEIISAYPTLISKLEKLNFDMDKICDGESFIDYFKKYNLDESEIEILVRKLNADIKYFLKHGQMPEPRILEKCDVLLIEEEWVFHSIHTKIYKVLSQWKCNLGEIVLEEKGLVRNLNEIFLAIDLFERIRDSSGFQVRLGCLTGYFPMVIRELIHNNLGDGNMTSYGFNSEGRFLASNQGGIYRFCFELRDISDSNKLMSYPIVKVVSENEFMYALNSEVLGEGLFFRFI